MVIGIDEFGRCVFVLGVDVMVVMLVGVMEGVDDLIFVVDDYDRVVVDLDGEVIVGVWDFVVMVYE